MSKVSRTKGEEKVDLLRGNPIGEKPRGLKGA